MLLMLLELDERRPYVRYMFGYCGREARVTRSEKSGGVGSTQTTTMAIRRRVIGTL
ncbi:hypothetical protein ACE6H2_025681 [Prunus campanulata]